jgi:hypothetical protein
MALVTNINNAQSGPYSGIVARKVELSDSQYLVQFSNLRIMIWFLTSNYKNNKIMISEFTHGNILLWKSKMIKKNTIYSLFWG